MVEPTSTELPGLDGAGAELLEAIARAGSVRELAAAADAIPTLQVTLVRSGSSARAIGLAIAAVTDALTRRLLGLAYAELGPAPVDHAWAVCGSGARRERISSGDQDNALVIADDFDPDEHGSYFEALARSVNGGLAACGFPKCPGGTMAENPDWRQPVSTWIHVFDRWIDEKKGKSVMYASIFFDMRVVFGERTLLEKVWRSVRPRAQRDKTFIAHLVANALTHRAPVGLLGRLIVEKSGPHRGTVDIKEGAFLPLVDLARIYAVAAGSPAIGTIERLRDAAEEGSLSRDGAAELERAFAFAQKVRTRHQTEQLEAGVAPDTGVRPDELSRIERKELTRCFEVIEEHQETLAAIYRARLIV